MTIDERGYVASFCDEWLAWKIDGDALFVPNNALSTLQTWWRIGVPIEWVLEAIDISMCKVYVSPRNKFVYMCGIIWNRLDNSLPNYAAVREEDSEGVE